MDKIGCELPERSPWDNRFYADPFLLSVGEDSFRILLKMAVKETDKERMTEQNELYIVRFDQYGIPTMEFDCYLY